MEKNKLNKILLIIFIIITILILLLFILGSFKRIGYLNEFKLISSKNGVYSYNFRVNYYSKIFRNSDIYKVYIDTNKIIKENNYIKKIIMNKTGSPFGVLESNIKIEKNIDGIVYTLKPKNIILALPVIFMVILLVSPLLFDLINRLLKINFRNRYAYIVIIFLSFLIMPNIIYKVFYNKFDHTQYEKRKFKEKPKFDLKALDKYPINYENYFNDNISLKNEFVKLKNLIDVFIFNNIIFNNVLLGKDRWLFFKSHLNMREINFEKNKNKLIFLNNELKKRNIDFILMICPNKEFVYSDYLPNYINLKDYVSPGDKFVEYITNTTDIKVVYPKKELLKFKNKYQLYYKYDHHWNSLGGYIGYLDLMKGLDMYDNKENLDSVDIIKHDFSYRNSSSFYNATANFIALSKLNNFKDDYVFVITNYINKNTNFMINNYFNFNFSYKNDYTDSTNKVYIIRDSMVQEMLDYLFPHFSEMYCVHFNNFKGISDIIDKKANIVICEVHEEGLSYQINKLK